MSIPFGDAIDLNQNELQNARLQNLSADPSGGVSGQMYFNTADLHHRVHDGASFKIVGFPTALTPIALTVAGAAAVGSALDFARADHAHAMPGAATGVAPGFMSAADKAKLDAATPSNTASAIAQRDAAGRMQVNDPVAAQDVATMAYVQAVANANQPKGNARARTTATVTIANPGTAIFDGVTLVAGETLAVMNQTAPAENGLYVFNGSASPLTRAANMNSWAEVPGAYFTILEGTSYADTMWLVTSNPGGTLGTTAIVFAQQSIVTTYTAANDPAITGVGVYGSTVGNQFRFRAVKAGSTKASVALSGADILIDVTEANLNLANIGGTLGLAQGGTGAVTAAGARTAIGTTGKFAATIGNGALTSFTINHNLNSADVTVTVWELTGQKRLFSTRVQISDANNIVVAFAVAPASNAYRVVVVG
jgi:hypothetical protein